MAIGESASNIVTLSTSNTYKWMIQLLHLDKEDVTNGSGFIELRFMIFCNPLLCYTSKSFFNFSVFTEFPSKRVANTSRVSKLFLKPNCHTNWYDKKKLQSANSFVEIISLVQHSFVEKKICLKDKFFSRSASFLTQIEDAEVLVEQD